ncbi:MAG: hypothetical protein DRP56_00825 [Planctomycetota bacterium]|nr:MAG: hypothetical protein DRP56_00825 [Planctomycetota bacterium]
MNKKTAWMILFAIALSYSMFSMFVAYGRIDWDRPGMIGELIGFCVPTLFFPFLVWILTVKRETLAFFYVGIGVYLLMYTYLIFGKVLGYANVSDLVR